MDDILVNAVYRRFYDKDLPMHGPVILYSLSYILYMQPTTPEINIPFSRYTDVKLDPYSSYW